MRTKYIILVMVYVLFHITGLIVAQEKGIIQLYLDPKMMVEGPYADSKSGELDLMIKAGLSNKTYEMGFFVEQFKALSYTSIGAYYNKKVNVEKILPMLNRFEFSAGLDTGFIHRIISNQKNYSFTAALNAETKYYIKKNFGVSLLSNYRYRGDLVHFYDTKNPMLFSGYVGLFYKF
ncbi:hypothetical protein QVZ41_09655 [Wenyingzhuangia sp. chi5]|uniref:Outer membrane protein beta-barrel domain-containing protein n=1 Tax=Wenyingzhuangia gilva TaxID=3057677 RepID=A0ABT8VT15_9FLAO|nr:hypothetical protein [Wenyingzhuangia sp. chi5]MDO3695108.1 hypothetical protein [Wenyingzhuangia sp. chi5]